MKASKTDIFAPHNGKSLEDFDKELDHMVEFEELSKSRMECICPGCGKMHILKMHWIGRGVPRKFCENCRNRETPLDDEAY